MDVKHEKKKNAYSLEKGLSFASSLRFQNGASSLIQNPPKQTPSLYLSPPEAVLNLMH